MSIRVFNMFAVLVVTLAALFVYQDLFSLWFTDVDTFPLISTGRIDSAGAAADVLSSPLMQGLMPNALFYRPFASVIWGIESWLWGLNPLGYHLVNLLLHVANCLLLFFLLRTSAQQFTEQGVSDGQQIGRSEIAALAAAFLFAIHPIGMETVPAIARRPDILFCFFMLLMLRQLGASLVHPGASRAWWPIVFCILGFASKDSAVVLPGIALAFVFSFSKEAGFMNRVTHSLRLCWPLIIAAALFLGLRTLVLGGLGGYAGADSYAEAAARSLYPYLCAFFFSGDLGLCLRPPWLSIIAAALTVVASLTLFCWVASRAVAGTWQNSAARILIFAALSLVGLYILHIAAGTAASMRTLYTALLFFSIIIAWSAVLIPLSLVSRGQLGLQQIALRAVHAVAGALIALAILGVLRGAWVGENITAWKVSADAAKHAFAELDRELESVPAGSVVYLVDFPFRVGRSLLFRERPIIIEHSVQGYVDLAFPDKQLDVVGLSYLVIEGGRPTEFASEVRFQADPARLDISTGSGGYAFRRPWFNPYARRSPWRTNTYFRDEAARTLRIDMNPELELDGKAVFLVYLGDRVERRGTDSWVLAHSPQGNNSDMSGR